ncbi:MAG: TonB-dependent receptor domain-containing protein [Acidobacteriota bacterium]
MSFHRAMLRALPFLLLAIPLAAQQDRATITGTVTDPTGSVVPNVNITIQNTETNAVYNSKTNDVGQYRVPNLPIGNYRATFEASGFKKAVREGMTLQVNQIARLDMTLEVGATAETIEVKAEVPLLTTESPDVGTVLDNRKVLDLPLSFAGGRDNEVFAYKLTPGVTGDSWTNSINGSPNFSKEVTLDGASVVVYIGGHYGEQNVSLEAVEEFKVQTSGLSAEFGRTGGGVFNFVMKSGTNQLHGSAVGLLKNEALDANTFSNNFYGRDRLKDRKHDYAFSLGGPVYLPKLYNGKDKTFFFFAYEKYTETNKGFGSPNLTLPLPEWYDGDFSRYLTNESLGTDALGNPIMRGAIYDPSTTQTIDGKTVKQMFPGNIIPANRISKVSQNLAAIMKQYYTPVVKQADGQYAMINNAFFPVANQPQYSQQQLTAKIDQNLSDRQKVSASYSYNYRPRWLIDSGGPWNINEADGGPLSRARSQNVKTSMGRFAHDYTVRPNLLNHFFAAVNRQANPSTSLHVNDGGGGILGITGIDQNGNYPEIDVQGGDRVNLPMLGYQSNDILGGMSWQVGNTVSWIKSRHSMKFGFDYRTNSLNSRDNAGPGSFNFGGGLTGLPGYSQTGHPFAQMMLGLVSSASIKVDTPTGSKFRDYALFFQDDFKATSRLTLNLGLRWDYQPQQVEKYNRYFNFCTTCIDPNTIGVPGAMQWLEGDQRTFFPNHHTDFGPRVGIAYQVNEKTAFRAGYGIYYLGRIPNDWSGSPYSEKFGFAGTNQVNDPGNNQAAFNWDGGYPGVEVPATKDPSGAQYWWGVASWDPNGGKNGYTQQWNANIQYELPGRIVLDLGYVGSKGTGIIANQLKQANQMDPKVLALGDTLNTWIDRDSDIPAAAKAMGAIYPFKEPGTWMPVSQALQPFPQIPNWSTVMAYNAPLGFNTYNSLQVSVNKQYSHGLSWIANYTFSKQISNVGSAFQSWTNYGHPLDYYNLALEKSVESWDRTHIVKMGFTYELPIGKGKPVAPQNRYINAVVGGWQVSYIGNYSSGVPLSFGGNGTGGWNGAVNRANINNPNGQSLYASFSPSAWDLSNANLPNSNKYVNTSLISDPERFTLGNSAPFISQIRGFAGYNEDIGVQKNFSILERFKVQFRADFLNAFNRHQFWNPDTWPANPTFGQVTGIDDGHREAQLGLRLDF